METFKKHDLIYEYNWSHYEKDDPRISGMPDATAFNRNEGWETLYLINFMADHVAWGVESFGNKMEKLIHDHLPVDIKNQKEAIRWIKDHWNNFLVN